MKATQIYEWLGFATKPEIYFAKFRSVSENSVSRNFGEFRKIYDYFGKNQNFCMLEFSKLCKI